MKLFLHIRITDDPLSSFSGKLQRFEDLVPRVAVFDMDNHSDALTLQTAIKAMHSSEKIFLYIEAQAEAELGPVLKILNQVIRIQSPLVIFYDGNHEILNRMMVRFQNKLIARDTSLRDAITNFFSL